MVVQDPNPLETNANITYLGFNQDQTCLAVGTWQGFMIFATESFALLHNEECGAVSLCEMLFRSSLLALAGYSCPGSEAPSSSARQLTMWNTKERRSIVQLHFNSRIHSVKMNHRRVVVLLQQKIHIFDLKTMKSLHVIDRTPSQWADPALGWLCASLERGYLATPLALAGSASLQGGHAWSSTHHTQSGGANGNVSAAAPDGHQQAPGTASGPDTEPGLVTIVDTYTLKPIGTLLAHSSPIQALCLNPTGQLLATASNKGTVIRLFAVPSFDRLCTFRRGNTPSLIHGLHFSRDSLFLCGSSASGTVHIFRNADKVLNSLPLQSEEATVGAAQREMIISQVNFREPEADEIQVQSDCTDADVEAEEINGWNVVFERPERVLERCNSWPKPSSPRQSPKISAKHAMQMISVGSQHAAGYTARYAKSLLQLLPASCRELVDAVRAFAWVRLQEEESTKMNRSSGSRSGSSYSWNETAAGNGPDATCHGGYIACINQKRRGDKGLEVMVATEHGCAHIYDCHSTTGGECRLRTEHSFMGQLIAKQHAQSRSARGIDAGDDLPQSHVSARDTAFAQEAA